jgi:hypothetical protein
MAYVSAPIDSAEVLPRLLRARDLLSAVHADLSPEKAREARALLKELEQMIEDILDLQESMEALDSVKHEGTVPWADVKARLGL